jgi:hypothetical protein
MNCELPVVSLLLASACCLLLTAYSGRRWQVGNEMQVLLAEGWGLRFDTNDQTESTRVHSSIHSIFAAR